MVLFLNISGKLDENGHLAPHITLHLSSVVFRAAALPLRVHRQAMKRHGPARSLGAGGDRRPDGRSHTHTIAHGTSQR